jgi:hypothetical protein
MLLITSPYCVLSLSLSNFGMCVLFLLLHPIQSSSLTFPPISRISNKSKKLVLYKQTHTRRHKSCKLRDILRETINFGLVKIFTLVTFYSTVTILWLEQGKGRMRIRRALLISKDSSYAEVERYLKSKCPFSFQLLQRLNLN